MAITPVTFSGLIQNTHDLSSAKTQADQQPMVQQDHASITVQREARQATQQVGDTQQTSEDSFDPSEGGDGTGYEGNRGEKRKKEEKKKIPVSDGSVKQKAKRSSFEASI